MRIFRLLSVLVLALAGSLQSGCVEPDLGDAPVYCNALEPRCPEGYSCVSMDKDEICVREGQELAPSEYADGG